MTGELVQRLRRTPALYLADQMLSSGTNFLAVVMVARNGTSHQFGLFSIFLVTFYLAAGFNRAVPHAIAMTLDWDDEHARNGYFFLPPLAVGLAATALLGASFALLDPAWLAVPVLLLPMLLQDAVRMHAFALQRPEVALASDAAWLAIVIIASFWVSTATGAATAWGLGALVAFLIVRPWRIRVRLQWRAVKVNAVSASLEYATLFGLGFLTPILASPIITVVGVGALQGADVIRGPILTLVQGLNVHTMSGLPATTATCLRDAARLSGTTLAVSLLCIPPLWLLRGVYGPHLLGATWPRVDPLVLPVLLSLVPGSLAFAPATVARKMGRFALSLKVQGALTPVLVGFPLVGALIADTKGFLYATAFAYVVLGVTWWIVLSSVATEPPPPPQGTIS